MAMRGETLLSAGLLAMVRLFFVSSPAVGDEELYQISRQALVFGHFRLSPMFPPVEESKVEGRKVTDAGRGRRGDAGKEEIPGARVTASPRHRVPASGPFRPLTFHLRPRDSQNGRVRVSGPSSPAAAFFRSSDRGEQSPPRPGGNTERSLATGRPGNTVRPSNRPC